MRATTSPAVIPTASPAAWAPPSSLPPTEITACDRAIEDLVGHKDVWVATPTNARVALLERCRQDLLAECEAWAETVCRLKGAERGSAEEGQEWMAGLMPMMRGMRYLIQALRAEGQPSAKRMWQRPDGQWVAEVFPQKFDEHVMYYGFGVELWIEPGQEPTQGQVYRRKAKGDLPPGKVGLVMGAGNQISIGPTDMLHKLFVEDEVVCLKMNPVNEEDGPHIERAFGALIEAGVLRVVYGGAEVGKHLASHPDVDTMHLTGADTTHDAIVWGADPEERVRRKATGERLNTRPFTSELGCVSPCFVVPGPWSEADLEYQAVQIASGLTQNAGFNCAAIQVLMLPSDWEHREALLDKLRKALARTPNRKSYYPGTRGRYDRMLAHYPNHEVVRESDSLDAVPWTLVHDVPVQAGERALCTEGFCGLLHVVDVPGDDAAGYLAQAVEIANQQLWGNLSCTLLCHPKTQKQYREAFDHALASLEYGTVCVNGWAGLGYAIMVSGWGGFGRNPPEDIQSGVGMVHNTFLFDHLQKSVVRVPWRGRPKPPWFVNHANLPALGRAATAFEAKPSLGALRRCASAALKG